MNTAAAVLVVVLVALLLARDAIARARRIAAMGQFYRDRAHRDRYTIVRQNAAYPMAPEDVLA